MTHPVIGSKAWRERIKARRVEAQARTIRCDLPAETAIAAVSELIRNAYERAEPDIPVLRIEDADVRNGGANALRQYLHEHRGPVVAHQYRGTAQAVVTQCREWGYQLSLARHEGETVTGPPPVYLMVRPDWLGD